MTKLGFFFALVLSLLSFGGAAFAEQEPVLSLRGARHFGDPGYTQVQLLCVPEGETPCASVQFVVDLEGGAREVLNPYRFPSGDSAYLRAEFERKLSGSARDGDRDTKELGLFCKALIERRFGEFVSGKSVKLGRKHFYRAADVIAQLQPPQFN